MGRQCPVVVRICIGSSVTWASHVDDKLILSRPKDRTPLLQSFCYLQMAYKTRKKHSLSVAISAALLLIVQEC